MSTRSAIHAPRLRRNLKTLQGMVTRIYSKEKDAVRGPFVYESAKSAILAMAAQLNLIAPDIKVTTVSHLVTPAFYVGLFWMGNYYEGQLASKKTTAEHLACIQALRGSFDEMLLILKAQKATSD
jgi:hypothetical protein